MNRERTLFDRPPPASHTHDPATSHEAEHQHTRSGARGQHCAVVLEAVRAHPCRTASELERWVPYDLQETRRRLTDLLHAGDVIQGDPRTAAGRRKREVTWSLA
jgi:hypothetical protein